MRYQTINKFRKTHRFLGIFIGIQFLFWTLSGLYFSWTNLDEIHGEQYRKAPEKVVFNTLIALNSLENKAKLSIESLELKTIGKDPFYWINDGDLYDATTGNKLDLISEKNALEVIQHNILDQYVVEKIERIDSVSEHDEYRGRSLPAYKVWLSGEGNPIAYVSARDGSFQRIRHRRWRWFDFLWMTHTMDYEGRDNFNTLTLRVFSFLGLITVMSGFALAFVTSKRRKKEAKH
jgi:hypothetical protein